jgi:hypothetical protein
MTQTKNNKIPLIMETPPFRIMLDASQHPVDKTDPVFTLTKTIDELAFTVNGILKKAGVK